MVNRTLHSSFFSSDLQSPNVFSLQTIQSKIQTIPCKIQTTVNSNQQKQITKQVKEQYPLSYFWVAKKTNQTLGKKSMYPQMFSVPSKRTKRSLARTKHAISEKKFPTLAKKKKKFKSVLVPGGFW